MKSKSGPGHGSWSRRPSFTPRQMLTAELLNAGLTDELMRQQLLNRAVHGYGVVLGLGLTVDDDGGLDLHGGCLELGAGLALDRHGRMLLWEGGRIGMSDLVGPPPQRPGRYTLCAHFARRSPLDDDCGPCAGDQGPWSEEGVVFSLHRECQEVERGCPDHPTGRCVNHEEYLARRTGGLPGRRASVPPSPDVDWLLRPPGRLRPTGEDEWMYDPDPEVCVPVACVQICDLSDGDGGSGHDPDTADQHGTDPDARAPDPHACEPCYGFCPGTRPEITRIRPLVYRNPLLYELASCCDVDQSRVESISWQDWIDDGWNAPVPWKAFEDRITSRKDGFEVWFTRPVDPRTLHGASIVMTASYQQDDASWLSYRVPLEVVPLGHDGDVLGARLVPDDEWLASEVTGRRSNLYGGTRVEITVRGQLLRDECGRMLDARPVGLECGVRCQARPGGDLVTAFQVAAHRRDRASAHLPHDRDGSGESPDEADASGGSAG